MALKKIFVRLGEVFKPGCILSSNTDVLNMKIFGQLSVALPFMPLPTSSSASLDQARPRRVQTQANLFGDVELVWHTKGVLNTESSAMPRPVAWRERGHRDRGLS